MTTAANFPRLDRVARTALPARLRTVGETTDADTFAALQPITSNARVSQLATRADALEQKLINNWNPAWNDRADARTIRAELFTAAELAALNVDDEVTRATFKTLWRIATRLACRAG